MLPLSECMEQWCVWQPYCSYSSYGVCFLNELSFWLQQVTQGCFSPLFLGEVLGTRSIVCVCETGVAVKYQGPPHWLLLEETSLFVMSISHY